MKFINAKKIISICFSAAIIMSTVGAMAEPLKGEWQNSGNKQIDLTVTPGNGACGNDMTWSLDKAGTLTISGTGEMYDYVDIEKDAVTIPWFEKNNLAAIKSIIVKDGVESINEMAFYGTSITSITLPNSVEKIGKSAIANCPELKEVVLSDKIKVIPDGLFNCNYKLSSIHLPNALETIDVDAFLNCYALQSVTLPHSVMDIKERAFANCTDLKEIVIPQGLTMIRSRVFQNDNNLKNILLPQGVKIIENNAFSGCANIEEIILPDGLSEIGDNAFSFSDSPRTVLPKKQKVYIPNTVTKLGKNAFDEEVIIYGFKNSTAETYAKENNIEFIEVSESMYDANSYKEAYYSQFQSKFEKLLVKNGDKISISLDNKELNFEDAEPFIDKNGRTQVPIRAVSEMLDCKVDWDGENKTAQITRENGDIIKLTLDSDIMTVNDKSVQMDTSAIIKYDRTYIPVRFVAEAMGLEVEWIE